MNFACAQAGRTAAALCINACVGAVSCSFRGLLLPVQTLQHPKKCGVGPVQGNSRIANSLVISLLAFKSCWDNIDICTCIKYCKHLESKCQNSSVVATVLYGRQLMPLQMIGHKTRKRRRCDSEWRQTFNSLVRLNFGSALSGCRTRIVRDHSVLAENWQTQC